MDVKAFFKVTYGLYIVSSRDGDKFNGHISNSVFQVTSKPARFAVASNKVNLTSQYIEKSKAFSISVLEKDCDMEFIGPWGFHSGKENDKFAGINYMIGKSGAPIILEKAIAYIDCKLVDIINTGTHLLFIGEAVDAVVLDDKKEPLTYDHYRNVIKGLSPETAPTYVEKYDSPSEDTETTKEAPAETGARYKCTVCGYIYDPAEGDHSAGIPPGTNFEDIPDDWICPICGVTKSAFIPV